MSDPARRRQARLLGAFLAIMLTLFALLDGVALATRPGYSPPWLGYAFMIGAWLLNRRGHYGVAAALTLAMFPAVIFGELLRHGSSSPAGSLSFLVPGLIVASILLPLRGLLLFAALDLAGVLAIPYLAPGGNPTPAQVLGPLVLVAITTGLLVVSMQHRDSLERERQAQLRDSEERLRSALGAARMLIWDWEIESGALQWQGEADGFLGRSSRGPSSGRLTTPPVAPAAAGPQSYAEYLNRVHEADRPAVEATLRHAFAADAAPFVIRHRIRGASGALRWIEAHGRLERNPAGQPVRMRGTVFDVTEQQRAEAEREQLLRELAAKNAELERFTYTASHDLKSPLVTVRGFLGFVEKDALEGNHERLKVDLKRIREATDRMGRLLDELLELSRVGRAISPPQPIALGELAREAVALVAGRIAAHGVEVSVADDLPVVSGDRVRLLQVLQNLLDNAVKFRHPHHPPRVEIGVRHGGETVFYVRDNGIGVLPRHHERVFGLFDKLDPDSDGTGVGLALVRRIVELHGGRVWVESEGDDTGSTFCFTLGTLRPPPPAGA